MAKRVLNNRGPRKADLQPSAKKPLNIEIKTVDLTGPGVSAEQVGDMLRGFRELERQRRIRQDAARWPADTPDTYRDAGREPPRFTWPGAEHANLTFGGIPVVVSDAMPPDRVAMINPTQPGGRVLRHEPDQIVQIKTDSFDDTDT